MASQARSGQPCRKPEGHRRQVATRPPWLEQAASRRRGLRFAPVPPIAGQQIDVLPGSSASDLARGEAASKGRQPDPGLPNRVSFRRSVRTLVPAPPFQRMRDSFVNHGRSYAPLTLTTIPGTGWSYGTRMLRKPPTPGRTSRSMTTIRTGDDGGPEDPHWGNALPALTTIAQGGRRRGCRHTSTIPHRPEHGRVPLGLASCPRRCVAQHPIDLHPAAPDRRS